MSPSSPSTISTDVRGRLSARDGTRGNEAFVDSYVFFGRANERVTITLDSGDIDSYVLLYDVAGRLIAENDDGGEGYNSRLLATLPADGVYRVVASSFYRQEEGTYRLYIERNTQLFEYPRLEVPGGVQGTFGELPREAFGFELDAEQTVSITLTSDAIDLRLRLYDSEGRPCGDEQAMNGAAHVTFDFTAPTAGRYYLLAIQQASDPNRTFEIDLR
jgi:serine protease Do